MWIVKGRKEAFGDMNGIMYGVSFRNNIGVVHNQFLYQHIMSSGKFDDVTPNSMNEPRQDAPPNAIFHHSGGIGDTLFITRAIAEFKKKFPSTLIDVSIQGSSICALQGNPYINITSMDNVKTTTFDVVNGTYDDAYSFDTIIGSNPFASVENIYDLVSEWMEIEIPVFDKKPDIHLNQNELDSAVSILRNELNIPTSDKIVMFQYSSSSNLRNISHKTALEVAEKIASDGYHVIIFGGRDKILGSMTTSCKCGRSDFIVVNDNIRSLRIKCKCGEIINAKKIRNNEKIHEIHGLSFRVVMAMIAMCDYMVGVDSSGLHVAGAFDKPMLGIFSSFYGDLRLRYYRNSSWIQKEFRCAPCFNHAASCHSMDNETGISKCMAQITSDEIYNEFVNLVNMKYNKPIWDVPQDPGCRICSTTGGRFLGRKGNSIYRECIQCGTIYSDVNITDYFEPEYDTSGSPDIGTMINKLYGERFGFRGNMIEINVSSWQIGDELRRTGWVSGCSDGSNKFDLILMEGLEKEADPKQMLEDARNLMRNGSVLVIITPNANRWVDKRNCMWNHINTPVAGENKTIFTESSMAYALQMCGLKLSVIYPLGNDFMLVEATI